MSDEPVRPRVRINAKQKASGEWYFDCTAETDNVDGAVNLLIMAIAKAQDRFKDSGRRVADDTG